MNGSLTKSRAVQLAHQLREPGGDFIQSVDIGVQWVCGDEELVTAGGVWDMATRSYVDDASEFITFNAFNGQRLPAIDMLEWLHANIAYRSAVATGVDRDTAHSTAWGDGVALYRMFLYGGRRSGKTHFAVNATILGCVAMPGIRAVVVSPELDRTIEMERLVNNTLPAEWARRTNISKNVRAYRFINGSTIEFHTGHNKELRAGELDMVLLNEAQDMDENVSIDAQGGLADNGGLLLITCNPPKKRKGWWVTEMYERIINGNDDHARARFLSPEKNPHIDLVALMSIPMDTETYRRDVEGDMSAPMANVVFPGFNKSYHVLSAIPFPWVDVTSEVARRTCGVDASYIGGIDFDKGAGCAWALVKFYAYDIKEWETAWPVVISGNTERDFQEWELSDRLLCATDHHGMEPFKANKRSVVWVADASGAWQNTQRDNRQPTSWDRMRSNGWTVVGPQARSDENPRVDSRLRLASTYLDNRDMYIMASAEHVIECVRDYPRKKNGEPDRRDWRAHVNDAWTYALFRVKAPSARSVGTGRVDKIERPKRRPIM